MRLGSSTAHLPLEVPEYAGIDERYKAEKKKLAYRNQCKDEAFCGSWVTESGNQRLMNFPAEQLLCDCEAITDDGDHLCGAGAVRKEEITGQVFAPGGDYI